MDPLGTACRPTDLPVFSFADAFAEGGKAGIGGWVIPFGQIMAPPNAFCVSMQLTKEDCSNAVPLPHNLPKALTCLETFAQTTLLLMESGLCPEAF